VIADVGFRHGHFSELFLRHGNEVFGIEPNPEMRHAAETLLKPFRISIASSEKPRRQNAFCSRVSISSSPARPSIGSTKSGPAGIRENPPARRWVVLLWNSRRIDSTPFLRAYEALLQQFGTDYREIQHKQIDHEMLGLVSSTAVSSHPANSSTSSGSTSRV